MSPSLRMTAVDSPMPSTVSPGTAPVGVLSVAGMSTPPMTPRVSPVPSMLWSAPSAAKKLPVRSYCSGKSE